MQSLKTTAGEEEEVETGESERPTHDARVLCRVSIPIQYFMRYQVTPRCGSYTGQRKHQRVLAARLHPGTKKMGTAPPCRGSAYLP
jgi:hypothetical protein